MTLTADSNACLGDKVKNPSIFFMMFLIANCASPSIGDGTLTMDQEKLRSINASFDISFQAAISALETLELSTRQKEKSAGVVSGIKKERSTSKGLQKMVSFDFLSDIVHSPEKMFEPSSGETLINIHLSPLGEKQTPIRIDLREEGEPTSDQERFDKVWIMIQKHAFSLTGLPLLPELKKAAENIVP